LDFLVRILFSGLIAFVPSEDGKEVTVLLLNVDHAYHSSDGSSLPGHKPMIVARAGSCTGQCPTRDSAIAQYVYADKSLSAAQDALEEAVAGGGAWVLDGSELSLRKGSSTAPALPPLVIRSGVRGTSGGQPQLIPTTATEREDFSWVANMDQLCSGCTLDTALFGSQPPAGLVAARFTLRSGKVFTWSVARIGSDVTPVHFQRLDGTGSVSSYTQAVASWVSADITVSGESIELVEEKFDGGTGRSMRLAPDANGKVEIAVLNLPPFVPPASPENDAPEAGKHFELFYELEDGAPAAAARLVPRAGAAPGAPGYPAVAWEDVHPSATTQSDLLTKLRLEASRTVYDRELCPPMQDPKP
jgi:hypothetical protein